jgi:ubiquinone/menaquinone biosynthesis C-methylase UbiE
MINYKFSQKLKLDLFTGRIDYKTHPRRLDLAQNTVNEMMQYIKAKEVAKELFGKRKIIAIDFCTGTGLFTFHILSTVNIEKIILLDVDRRFLNFTKKRLKDYQNAEFVLQDAVTFTAKEKAHLILLGSAYHHIEDSRKIEFLKNVERNLRPEGYVLMADHFIPSYNNEEKYSESIMEFYTKLIKYLELSGTSSTAIRIIKQVAYYGYIHEYEYKVSYKIFKEHLKETNLIIEREYRVWPEKDGVFADPKVGSFLIVLRKKIQKNE